MFFGGLAVPTGGSSIFGLTGALNGLCWKGYDRHGVNTMTGQKLIGHTNEPSRANVRKGCEGPDRGSDFARSLTVEM